MIFWGQLNLQEGSRTSIELLNYFHDYIIIFLLLILSFVTYLFLYVSCSPYSDKYTIDSHLLETIWTIVPIVILVFIAFPSLYLLYMIEEISSPSISVKAIGHQWYWEYQYFNSWLDSTFDSYIVNNDGSRCTYHNLDVDNRLVLPSLSNIMFLVTSADVIHRWTVPSLGIKVDAIPGRLNYLTSLAYNSGVYFGQCREICGANHSFMPIVVEFVPMDCFLNHISSIE